MGTARQTPAKSIWRHALAIAAAYLLVLQAALAGAAMQRMETSGAFSTAVLCLNGDSQGEDQGGQRHVAFDCCGFGCLVGSHAVEGPFAPDQNLAYPAERAYDVGSTPSEAKRALAKAHGPGLRGPPVAA